MNKRSALIHYLEDKKFEFWSPGGGGCETCGYGGEGEIDFPALLKSIDDFEATFKPSTEATK